MSRILENNMVTTKGPKVNVTIAKKYFLNKKKNPYRDTFS